MYLHVPEHTCGRWRMDNDDDGDDDDDDDNDDTCLHAAGRSHDRG